MFNKAHLKISKLSETDLRDFLDSRVDLYNRSGFIQNDPISIPHQFTKRQDIEIAGLFAAVLAWGQRVTIINKCNELMELMDQSPYEFIVGHKTSDLRRLKEFKHRTFNSVDLNYFISFLSFHYGSHDSLEDLFLSGEEKNVEGGLIRFHNQFFSLDHYPSRTRKHISTPERKSACKRINMYLRWMVRSDDRGVDFGLWKRIRSSQLVCPCDVHVERVARKLRLMKNNPLNWQTAVDLTERLKKFDPNDPVKYDFALFGLGIDENF